MLIKSVSFCDFSSLGVDFFIFPILALFTRIESGKKKKAMNTLAFGVFGYPRMVSKTSSASSPSVPIKYKLRKVMIYRDFPKGCGPSSKVDPKVLQDSEKSLMLCTLHDVEKEPNKPIMLTPSREKEGSRIVEPERVGLPKKKDVEKTFCISYPPRRKISAIRRFPPGCGTNTLPISKEEDGLTTVDSMGVGLPNATDTLGHENTKLSKEDEEESLCKLYPPRKRAIFRSYPLGSGSESSQIISKEDCAIVAIDASGCNSSGNKSSYVQNIQKRVMRSIEEEDCVLSTFKSNLHHSKQKSKESARSNVIDMKDKSLGNGRIGKLQENVSAGLVLPGPRIVVQALMAAPKCPWRSGGKRKRTYNWRQQD